MVMDDREGIHNPVFKKITVESHLAHQILNIRIKFYERKIWLLAM
jgi:hypothetical protein